MTKSSAVAYTKLPVGFVLGPPRVSGAYPTAVESNDGKAWFVFDRACVWTCTEVGAWFTSNDTPAQRPHQDSQTSGMWLPGSDQVAHLPKPSPPGHTTARAHQAEMETQLAVNATRRALADTTNEVTRERLIAAEHELVIALRRMRGQVRA